MAALFRVERRKYSTRHAVALLLIVVCCLLQALEAESRRTSIRQVRVLAKKKATSKAPAKSPSTKTPAKKKPPPPKLRLVPFSPVPAPSPPFVFRLPPDLPPPPYPAAPPAPTRPNVGTINNLNDVCTVCTSLPYNGTCDSTYAKRCLSAMNTYRMQILKIQDTLCSCHTTIALQLIQFCPGVNTAISYLQNCDGFCYYGPRCTMIPTLYALLKPELVIPDDRTIALPGGSAAAVLNFFPQREGTGSDTLYFQLLLSSEVSAASPQSAAIYRGVMGKTGSKIQNMFTVGGVALTGSVPTTFAVAKAVTNSPNPYYVQMDTLQGSVRGQLVFNPTLFGLFDNNQLSGASCSGQDCSGIATFRMTSYSISYNLNYSSTTDTVTAAQVAVGSPGNSGSKLFDLFGPGTGATAERGNTTNGLTPARTAIMQLMSAPFKHYILIATESAPFGAMRGQFQDSIRISATLTGAEVMLANGTIGSGFAGSAVLTGVAGGGGICYTLAFSGVSAPNLATITFGYIHVGYARQRGAVAIQAELPVVPNVQQCIEADSDATAAFLVRPLSAYVQLYNTISPFGLLRGQIRVIWPTF